MFQRKDKEEELQRLQQELLAEEEVREDEIVEEEYLNDDVVDALLDEDTKVGSAGVYQNYSNDYGRNLRNFATGYKAYNSDSADVDLEEYSQEVLEPKKRGGLIWFLLILMTLLCVAAVALVIYYLRLGGIL